MRTAIIKTDFWESDKVSELNSDTRSVYLCLLTNPKRNTTPVFQISDRLLSFYTGYNLDIIKLCVKQLIEKNFIGFIDNYYILLETEYVDAKKGRLTKGIENAYIKSLPMVIQYILVNKGDSSSTPLELSLEYNNNNNNNQLVVSNMVLETSNSELETPNSKLETSNLNLKTSNMKLETPNDKLGVAPPAKPKKVIGPKTPEFLGSEINEVIQILSPLNPDWKSWFKPGAQRTSVMKLMQFVKTDGNDLNKLVDKVMVSRGKQYEVQIYSPCDMVEKYAKLVTKRRKAIELSSENIITKGRYEDSFKEMADLKKKKEEEYRLKTL